MKRFSAIIIILSLFIVNSEAQIEKNAGNWRTWFIGAAKEYRLTKPASAKSEIEQVLAAQRNLDDKSRNEIDYWNAGPAGYRWKDMKTKLWLVGTDTGYYGILANLLVNAATYDAMLWTR